MFGAGSAAAHPHVWVTARTEIVFGAGDLVVAIRHIWQFDPAFSAYAMQGYDGNNDGVITTGELAPLAQINVESLAEYGFFTELTSAARLGTFTQPAEYWLDVYGGQLTLFYTLPLTEPMEVGDGIAMEVFDPEYFVAFEFDVVEPVLLVNAPDQCSGVYHPPRVLDDEARVLLAAIPADQELPPDLIALTTDLGNVVEISCQ